MIDLEKIHFRLAHMMDVDLYYEWANDELVRDNSFNSGKIDYASHVSWFCSKLKSIDCVLYVFFIEKENPVGQVRIDRGKRETVINISVDKKFRGKSIGAELLKQATNDYFSMQENEVIVAYIKLENLASLGIFEKAGFCKKEIVVEKNCKSYKLFKKSHSSNG